MFNIFMRIVQPCEADLILDVGVTPNTTRQDSNYFEKFYPHKENITMSSIEDASNLEKVFPKTKFIKTIPGDSFPFSDKQFDIVFCAAVLEHVGDYLEQKKFLSECIRVGKKVFLTTPNKWFPIEFHTCLPFIHWLPQKAHQKILATIGFEFYSQTENLNLLTKKTLLSILPSSSNMNTKITFNKLLGLPTNIILYVEVNP